jgi:hypothetical protein
MREMDGRTFNGEFLRVRKGNHQRSFKINQGRTPQLRRQPVIHELTSNSSSSSSVPSCSNGFCSVAGAGLVVVVDGPAVAPFADMIETW